MPSSFDREIQHFFPSNSVPRIRPTGLEGPMRRRIRRPPSAASPPRLLVGFGCESARPA